MLCFRCEHRARNLTAKYNKEKHVPQPRCECGDIESSVWSCYMFQPCKPVVTEPSNKDDIRPRLSMPMLSSRERAVRVLDEAKAVIIYQNEDEVAIGWKVERKE